MYVFPSSKSHLLLQKSQKIYYDLGGYKAWSGSAAAGEQKVQAAAIPKPLRDWEVATGEKVSTSNPAHYRNYTGLLREPDVTQPEAFF